MISELDTIFALSSGQLPAGIAVIRVSGRRVNDIVSSLCGFLPSIGELRYAPVRGRDDAVIDRGMVVRFEAPRSFTGEDSAEFHLHGSRAVVARFQAELSAWPGVRLAEPGEFTLRAFQNGRVDLTEAEALSDLIVAETELQREFAVENGSGRLRELYDAWRGEIVEMMAMAEASVDFADEDDVPDGLDMSLVDNAHGLARRIETHIAAAAKGEIIRDGFRVVLVGAPNAGKSSLLNCIAGRDVAIVTHEAGTTRDILSVDLDLGGVLTRISDTAGLRQAEGLVEKIGVERSLAEMRRSHLVLLVEDMNAPLPVNLADVAAPVLRVGNKSDLPGSRANKTYDVQVSAATGEGVDVLMQCVERRALDAVRHADLVPYRKRHVDLLARCVEALRGIDGGDEITLQVENLRIAAHALGRITGRVDVEDLLDVIFSRFCIGK